jgi:hypothetical protein
MEGPGVSKKFLTLRDQPYLNILDDKYYKLKRVTEKLSNYSH